MTIDEHLEAAERLATSASPALPRTERTDPPAYLNRHLTRRRGQTESPADEAGDDATPLYLRRFRERDHHSDPVTYDGDVVGSSRAWAEVTRTKEIVPERRDQLASVDCDIYLVRHGETQGYSSESGLTPLGSWQAHRRGQELARRVTDGMALELVCAPTDRARQTAEHLRRGLLDNLRLFGRDASISETHDDLNFRNFEVATPEGPRDVTSAFRVYHREMEKYERVGLGERPGWRESDTAAGAVHGASPVRRGCRPGGPVPARRQRPAPAGGSDQVDRLDHQPAAGDHRWACRMDRRWAARLLPNDRGAQHRAAAPVKTGSSAAPHVAHM